MKNEDELRGRVQSARLGVASNETSMPVRGRLYAILALAMKAHDNMSPLERLRNAENQRINFAWNSLTPDSKARSSITQVRRVALEMWLNDRARGDLHAQRKLELRLLAMGVAGSYWLAQGHPLPRGEYLG